MSTQRISHDEARTLIQDLQAKNIRAKEIRRQLQEQGFSLDEINDLMGVAPPRRAQLSTLTQNGQTISHFKRGNLLTTFLEIQIVVIIGTLIILAWAFFGIAQSTIYEQFRVLVILDVILLIALGVLQLVCTYWLWQGLRKGYMGLIIVYVLVMLGYGILGITPAAIINLVSLVLLVLLVQPKYPKLAA